MEDDTAFCKNELVGTGTRASFGRGKAPPLPPAMSKPRMPCTPEQAGLKLKCGGPVHRKTLETALGGERLGELTWPTEYGPPILPTTVDMLWGPVIGPEGTGIAKLTDEDTFVELGCGQGGVLLAAHRSAPKCRIVGVELDPAIAESARAKLSAEVVSKEGEEQQVTVLCGGIDDYLPNGDADVEHHVGFSVSMATIVYMFLSQYAMLRLRPKLLSAMPVGSRILCRRFTMGRAWPADEECYGADGKEVFRLYIVTADRKDDPVLRSSEELEETYALLRAKRPDDSSF